MSTQNKQQLIVAILRRELDSAINGRVKAGAERAAAIAAANIWDQYHQDDGVGGFRQNPHKLDRVDQMEIDAVKHLGRMQEAYDYAVDTFLGDKHAE